VVPFHQFTQLPLRVQRLVLGYGNVVQLHRFYGTSKASTEHAADALLCLPKLMVTGKAGTQVLNWLTFKWSPLPQLPAPRTDCLLNALSTVWFGEEYGWCTLPSPEARNYRPAFHDHVCVLQDSQRVVALSGHSRFEFTGGMNTDRILARELDADSWEWNDVSWGATKHSSAEETRFDPTLGKKVTYKEMVEGYRAKGQPAGTSLWDSLAERVPFWRKCCATATVGDRILVAGGYTDDEPGPHRYERIPQADGFLLDPMTGNIEKLGEMPKSLHDTGKGTSSPMRTHCAGSVSPDGKHFVVTGGVAMEQNVQFDDESDQEDDWAVRRSCMSWNFAERSWEEMTPLTAARASHQLVLAGGHLIALGGAKDISMREPAASLAEVFDHCSGKWFALPIQQLPRGTAISF